MFRLASQTRALKDMIPRVPVPQVGDTLGSMSLSHRYCWIRTCNTKSIFLEVHVLGTAWLNMYQEPGPQERRYSCNCMSRFVPCTQVWLTHGSCPSLQLWCWYHHVVTCNVWDWNRSARVTGSSPTHVMYLLRDGFMIPWSTSLCRYGWYWTCNAVNNM